MNDSESIFSISVEWVQYEALLKCKRRLTEDELLTAKKCIEYGLLTSIDIVFDAAIGEALCNTNKDC